MGLFLLKSLATAVAGLSMDEFASALEVVRSHRLADLKLNVVCDYATIRKAVMQDTLDQAVGFDKRVTEEDSLIYCLSHKRSDIDKLLMSDNGRHAVGNIWVLIGKTEEVVSMNTNLCVNINRLVYFLDTVTGRLTETYSIANMTVSSVLGHIGHGGSIHWERDNNVLNRRADFMGLHLRAGSFAVGAPMISYSNEDRKHFRWTKDRKGSLVADVTDETASGAFVEVMDVLQSALNFSTSKIVRKDGSLGFPRFVNGTFVGYTGIIGDLLSRDIDLVMAPMRHVIERYSIMDFLHGIGTYTNSILVNANAGNEEQEWLTYLLPFRANLWLLLFANSLCATVAITLVSLLYFTNMQNVVLILFDFLASFWMILMSYFGKPLSVQKLWQARPTRILLFFIFFSGNLVFMFYKAGLTTELSIKAQKLPFNTAKGLYESNYR